jgi:histidinol phosphatase-like PHP family hydrolase
MILTDLHIHSNFSDGKHSIPEIVDFYGSRGFGAVAITDHLCEDSTFLGKAAAYLERTLTPATFPLYMEILKSEAERAKDQYGMVVIPGFEITKNSLSNHRSAHIIGLGVSEFTRADGDITDILKNLRNQGALTIAAHPVSNKKLEKQTLHLWNHKEELAPLFDAWEVGSGVNFFEEVARSGLPTVASTDLHRFSQMTGWKTFAHTRKSEKKAEAILDAVRMQNVSFHYYKDVATELTKNLSEVHQHGTVPFPHPALGIFPHSYGRGHIDLIQTT